MTEFKNWLNNHPGMATRLRKKLDLNATNISNWKHGRKPIPWAHMRKIANMSKGEVSLKQLMDFREANF